MYSSHILNISGKQSVAIVADELAVANNRDTSEKRKFKWEAVRIYKLDPEWKARQEKKTNKKLAPYWIGIAKGSLWAGEGTHYTILYANTVGQSLSLVRSTLPEFTEEIEYQLGQRVGPIRELEHESSRRPVE